MSNDFLLSLRSFHDRGERRGITSVCSAHPDVIRGAIAAGRHAGEPILIEATCNQVNQDGGYTGMTPADFRRFVEGIAQELGFDTRQLILGGDHLGPNPWAHLPHGEAMAKAKAMIAAFAAAGFTKLHLDCSMGCAGEPGSLEDELVAHRAAELARVAEDHSPNSPVYVIGTEVPVPGGASHEVGHLEVTRPEAARRTFDVHRLAFTGKNLEKAFDRIIGLVVQPGVEFGSANVVPYRPEHARTLAASLGDLPELVFEAHSTDYQSPEALSALVDDGFSILKVGPGLTFALREALYGLDSVASELDGKPPLLKEAMEALMLEEPGNWARYYSGEPDERRVQRHFSYSDRIRYYWPHPRAEAAVSCLSERLRGRRIPETLISQYLPSLLPGVKWGNVAPTMEALRLASVELVLRSYADACGRMATGED